MCKIWPTSLRCLGLKMRIKKHTPQHTILYKLYTNPETALSARLVSLASRRAGPRASIFVSGRFRRVARRRPAPLL